MSFGGFGQGERNVCRVHESLGLQSLHCLLSARLRQLMHATNAPPQRCLP